MASFPAPSARRVTLQEFFPKSPSDYLEDPGATLDEMENWAFNEERVGNIELPPILGLQRPASVGTPVHPLDAHIGHPGRPAMILDDDPHGDNSGERTDRPMDKASKAQANRLESERRNHMKLVGEYQILSPESPHWTSAATRYCPPLQLFLPPPIPCKFKNATVPQDVLRAIKIFPRVQEQPIRPSPFRYTRSVSAATFNSSLLAQYDYDIQKLIDAYPGSILSPGCEFQSISRLRVLLGRHPFWPVLENMMTSGVHFKMKDDVDDEARRQENEALLSRGNHKSARDAPDDLHAALDKDTTRGFSVPLLRESIQRIPEARVAPMGIARQLTVTETGERKPKIRLTHDQSFSTGIIPSVNELVDLEGLPDLVFGWALHRLIHHIIALRQAYRFDPIFICKFDYSSAYRRLTMDGVTSARSITVDGDGIAHMPTRCTFGGSPNPFFFSVVSEATTDLSNDVLKSTDWSPPLPPEPIRTILSSPIELDDDIYFADPRPLAVTPDPAPEGKSDVFIDDNILIFRGTPENLRRAPFVIPAVIAAMSRPNSDQEQLPRDEFLTLSKLEAEGAPAEIRIVLGWQIDTRRLLISLPRDKHATWRRELQDLLQTPTAAFSTWDSLLGRLNHAAEVIPLSRYFLGHLRAFLEPYSQGSKRHILPRPPSAVTQDLQLWTTFLDYAHAGVSMNLLTTRMPTHILLSDACPHGMGGYSIGSGRAWHLQVPPGTHPDVSNNLLEFVACVVNLWIEEYDRHLPPESCVLALSDNNSAVGWLHGANFGATRPRHTMAAYRLTNLVLDGAFCLHPSHIPGIENEVADLLSREFDLADDDLTSLIHTHYSHQIPATFRISPLPNEIVSWIYSVLHPRPRSCTDEPPKPNEKKNWPGSDGVNTSRPSALEKMSTCLASTTPVESQSPSLLSNTCAASEPLHVRVRNRFAQALSERPLAVWSRNSGASTGEAPSTCRHRPGSSTQQSRNS